MLTHISAGFGIDWSGGWPRFTGSAWNSFFTTIEVAAIAAPLTAIVGLLSAYVITRHRFAGRARVRVPDDGQLRRAGHGDRRGLHRGLQRRRRSNSPAAWLILVLCFVFRNMPVGVRAGIAALAQIDKSLDEASSTCAPRPGAR